MFFGEENQEIIDSYTEKFAQPMKGQKCLKCGESLRGLFGTFQWGLCSGEGTCSSCGWPARAHHNIKTKDGEELTGFFECLFQYHPDFVEEKDSERRSKASKS